MTQAELDTLREAIQAACEGFNRKDVEAWLGSFHEDGASFNHGFIQVADVRPMADAILASAKSFNVDNVEGRIVGDTAVLFGDYRYELADGSVEAGAFSATYARSDGEWKALFSHYTPR